MEQSEENRLSAEVARQQRRARRRRLYRLRQRVIEAVLVAVVISLVLVPILLLSRCGVSPDGSVADENSQPVVVEEVSALQPPQITADTFTLTDEVDAQSAILVDVTANRVVAVKQPHQVLFPASITKVMTLLVAVEHIRDFEDTFVMTYEILHPLYLNNATIAGFVEGEAVRLEDLLYGCILPSGADATQALAEYIAGSEVAFAYMMNEKAEELGLQNTHFVNTSGLHDADHYTTAADMALVMAAAMKDPHCRQVLCTYQYTTAATPEHPEGILLTSTMFSRMYGTEPDGALIIGGKTGYTSEAGHTMVSYAIGDDRHDYVLVTMKGSSRWKATYDAIDTFTLFCAPTAQESAP